MKTTLNLLLSIVVFTVLIFSCKKESDNSSSTAPNPSSSNYYMTAKIDGVEFTAASAPLVSYGADVTLYYTITGINSDGDKLIINLKSPTSTGTFPTGTDSTATHQISVMYSKVGSSLSELWSTRKSPGSGTIAISQNTDANMKGTFSFTGINFTDGTSKIVTEGKFNAQKQ